MRGASICGLNTRRDCGWVRREMFLDDFCISEVSKLKRQSMQGASSEYSMDSVRYSMVYGAGSRLVVMLPVSHSFKYSVKIVHVLTNLTYCATQKLTSKYK